MSLAKEKLPEGFKRCWACKEVLPIEAFNRDRNRKDGHEAACRECEKVRKRNLRKEPKHKERNRKYGQERSGCPYYSPKLKAMWAVGKALLAGEVRKGPCAVCGVTPEKANIQGHHPDYSRHLDIIPLCQFCHKRLEEDIAAGGIDPFLASYKVYRFVDAFAGLGGMSLGLQDAGWVAGCAFEQNYELSKICKVLNPLTRKADYSLAKMAEIWSSRIPRRYGILDLLSGSIPFGAKKAVEELAAFSKLIELVKPETAILCSSESLFFEEPLMLKLAGQLRGLSYRVTWRPLSAQQWGVYIDRRPLFLVALKNQYAPRFAWPEPPGAPPSLVCSTDADGVLGVSSLRELAAVQGFPPHEIYNSERRLRGFRAREAVPPPLAEAVGRAVLEAVKGKNL
jgi:hypothetical protein